MSMGYYGFVRKKILSRPPQLGTGCGEVQAADAREQALRILARIIARKRLRDVNFQEASPRTQGKEIVPEANERE